MPYHILKISASRLVLPASSAPCQGDAHLAVANQLPSLATPRVIYGGSCLTRPPFDAPSQMRTSYPTWSLSPPAAAIMITPSLTTITPVVYLKLNISLALAICRGHSVTAAYANFDDSSAHHSLRLDVQRQSFLFYFSSRFLSHTL